MRPCATLLHAATGRSPGAFPFDSQRIEVPPDLPVREPLVRLIEALKADAPAGQGATTKA